MNQSPLERRRTEFPFIINYKLIFRFSSVKCAVGPLFFMIGVANISFIQHYTSKLAFPIWSGLVVCTVLFKHFLVFQLFCKNLMQFFAISLFIESIKNFASQFLSLFLDLSLQIMINGIVGVVLRQSANKCMVSEIEPPLERISICTCYCMPPNPSDPEIIQTFHSSSI